MKFELLDYDSMRSKFRIRNKLEQFRNFNYDVLK